ncbi:glycosyltransferase family 4 protein [Bradyrhizobium canariense]|uniref:Glycosyltransferase involved in cell wall bisynthesis n=1 Tax=Bradyrhizobium canariense TaxID=255045 RepID=A0A1H2BJH2_9BRAD|nr:glycosyltransferase family 4 protein [Bradyrhizobium canariense]SDT58403.1 Glycosyltransferase involved in cell wall bisynthesis [Bradyrhizobium canariense]
MRILQLLNHTRRLNGHVHAAVDLACAQAKLGHSVAMASGGGDFDALLAANGVETRLVNQERRPATLVKGLGVLYRLVRDWKADVVHAHMMTSAVLAWPICKSLGIPLVTTVHNEFEKGSILMGLGTRVVAVSAAVGQSMQKRGISKSRLSVVLNGTIGSARFEGKDRTPRRLESPAIIFVGGQHPRKGIPDLLAAFNIVHNKNPATRLYVLGDGPYLDTYVNQASTMECGSAVTFMGAQDDPFPFLLGADIFVLPSHADPAPLVLSEAREAGCAIVATDVDGIPELLEGGKAGILVPARDPLRLAEALCTLVENAEALQEWRNKSQFNIEQLRIERVARQTLEVYAVARRQIRGQSSEPV